VTDEVIQAHLEGRQPYGVYLLVADRTRALAVDFDTPDLVGPMEFVEAARGYGMAGYIERSKSKGHHVWIFCEPAGVSAAKVRTVVRHILEEICQPRVEVFPKQDRLDPRAPYGSFVNAPLFGALVPQDRTVFVEPGNPTQRCADQWALLASVERVSEQLLDQIIGVNELDDAAAPLRNPPPASGASATVCYGLPPCARRMLAEGVEEYQRVACFRLAVHLRRAGLPHDAAVSTLEGWAQRNRPADGKGRITLAEIQEQTACAYRGEYRSCGCEDPAVQPFCSSPCPVRASTPRHPISGVDEVPRGMDHNEGHPPPAVLSGCSSEPRACVSERSSIMAERTPQRPVKEFRAGGIKIAIWKNEVEQNGQHLVRHSVRIGKRYFDRQQNAWLNSDCFFVSDLPRLRLLLEKAFEFVVLKESDPEAARAANEEIAEAGIDA
jgi:hypothetical protein